MSQVSPSLNKDSNGVHGYRDHSGSSHMLIPILVPLLQASAAF